MEGLGNLIMWNSCKPRIRWWGRGEGVVPSLSFLFAASSLHLTLMARLVFSATTFSLLFYHIILFKICWDADFWKTCASYPFLFLGDEKLGFSLPLILWFHVPRGYGCHSNYHHGFHRHLYSISIVYSNPGSETILDRKSILFFYHHAVLLSFNSFSHCLLLLPF